MGEVVRTLQLHSVYKHFKGNYYYVEAVARDSETEGSLVIYRKLYGDRTLWARPVEMFLSPVDKHKYPDVEQTYRFEEVPFGD
ncbi:DUF1653 domain-containing protein [Alloscardovia criceti]|uniref:DUF1653 domain-containing protein n=1 Tax=Alloscardovia criceti TaxID=356828 RepID=UPI000366BAA8